MYKIKKKLNVSNGQRQRKDTLENKKEMEPASIVSGLDKNLWINRLSLDSPQ